MTRRLIPCFILALALLSAGANPLPLHAVTASPAAPLKLFPTGYLPPAATALALQGDVAYLGAGPALVALSVADPSTPQRLSYRLFSGQILDLAAWNAFVYVLTADDRLAIVDASRPEALVLRGLYVSPTKLFRVTAQQGFVYLAGHSGLTVLDASNPSAPVPVAELPTPATAGLLALAENRLYLGSFGTKPQFWIVDISDPMQPGLLGTVEFQTSASYPSATWTRRGIPWRWPRRITAPMTLPRCNSSMSATRPALS